MNVINVKVDFENGICEQEGIACIAGDFNSTKIVFDFVGEPEGTKVFELKDPKDQIVFVDEIIDNEVVLVGTREVQSEQEETESQIASIFTEAGDYVFEISLYTNDSKLTSVCDYITVKPEQVVVDGEAVEGSLTLFDNLMQELNTGIEETNNLDIDAEKVDHTTTITITKKDGSQETVEINDGETPDLSDYYTKEETYSKGEVDNLIPDLTNYVQFTDYATTSKGGVIKVNNSYATSLDSSGRLQANIRTYENYLSSGATIFVSKGTLDNVITGKGLVSNTNYATNTVGGVLKINTSYGISVDNGTLYPLIKTYEQYTSANDYLFVSKGTLENVIAGKDLTTKEYVDGLVGDVETILEELDIGGGTNG